MGGEDRFMVRPIEGKIDLILPSKSKHQLKHTLQLNQIPTFPLDFEREMKIVKEGWEEKKKTMEKRKIKWEWTSNGGSKYDGEYEGQVKGDVPHGLGKWESDGYNWTIEGEWEDGLLNGRVVENNNIVGRE